MLQEDASDNLDSGPNHFQPMVAVMCGKGKLLNKYLDENRRWVTDSDPKSVCTKDKLEILEYCRKVGGLVLYVCTELCRWLGKKVLAKLIKCILEM